MKPAAPATTRAPTQRDAPPEGRPVEFHRLDASRRITAIVLLCPLPVIAGMLVLMRPVQARLGGDPWIGVALLGLALVAAGPLSMILALRRVLQAEQYILLRTDGLLDHTGGEPVLHRWEDIERVVHDAPAHAIVLRRRNGGRTLLRQRFAGISRRDLAARLDEVRRKSDFDLL